MVLNRIPTMPGVGHSFFDFTGQVQQVHVAAIAFVPDAADSNLGLSMSSEVMPVAYSIACDAPWLLGWVIWLLYWFKGIGHRD